MLNYAATTDNNLRIYSSKYIQEFITYNLQIDDICSLKITCAKTAYAGNKWKS